MDLLKNQRKNIGQYWSDAAKQQEAFANGDLDVGTTWQYTANLLTADKKPVKTVLPSEGSTGWSDTWMISSKAKHPNCMYKWMDYIVSPSVNAQVAEYFGEAPAQTLACQHTSDKTFCQTYHALDQSYSNQLPFWTTPTKNCGDDRGDKCKDYSEWVQAWTEIKG